MDPNRVEGKRLTTVDVGDVMQLKYKKEQGTCKGKVLKFFRSRVTKSVKRDACGKISYSSKISYSYIYNIYIYILL